MGDNSWQTVDIHLHYGGYFKWEPRIRYTGEHVRVFCDFDPDELSVFEFQKMYQTIERGVTNMNFWYSIPFHDIDFGVVSINDDVDIELLTTCYEGLKEMHIYAERGSDPIEVVSPEGKLLYKRVTGDGILALPYHDAWQAEMSSSSTVKGKDDMVKEVIGSGSEDNNDIPDINNKAKDVCEEKSSQMESDPAVMGPHKEKIHDAGDKSKRKKARNDKKVKSQRVKLSARKSVRRLFKDKEEGDTSSEFRQCHTRKSTEETTQTERDPTSEQTDCYEERPIHEDGEEDEIILDYSDFPDWLREAVQLSEDDDIFAGLHGQGSTQASINIGSANSVGIPSEQQQENQQAKASNKADLDEQHQKQHENQQPTKNPEVDFDEHQQQQQNQQEQDWNEAVDDDENLFDRGIGSDDESTPVYSYFNADEEFRKEHFELKAGQKFSSFHKFREVLVEWGIREGYEHKYIRNEGSRITAKCARGCSWRIHASRIQRSKTFMIKTLKGDHHCGRDYSNRHATSTYLSHKFQAKVRNDPGCSIPGMMNETRRLFMLDISQKKAARTKQKALEALRGNDMEQYHRLWDYVATVKNSNPDSHISLQIDRRNIEERATFQRIYYGLGALKNGFLQGCRPIIGLDGCFLKSPFGGQLLTALGRDANENMFPISFAVVEIENYDSWSWFLRELISQIGRGNKGVAYTFISDRQKGLVHAIEELFPESEHRFCLKHMFENFKLRFKDQDLRDLFWEVAAAASMPEHETALSNLERADPQEDDKLTAAGWFKRLPRKLWSRAHFSTACRSDTCVNNMSESWNNYILKARGEPIITMLEWIRRRLMQRLVTKREGMLKHGGTLCPNIYEKLEKLKIKARNCVAVYGGNGNLEVDGYGRTNVVNLELKTCTCGHFQLSGIPCVHAVACIQSRKLKFEEYVDACYHREAYLRAYNFTIGPVPSKQFWVDSKMQYLNPPLVKKQPGRPKKQRKKGPEEPTNQQKASRKGLAVYCRRCLKTGHNIRTCKSAIDPKSKLYKAPKVGQTASNATSVASAAQASVSSTATTVSQEPNQPIGGTNQESQQSRFSKRKQPAATSRMSRLRQSGSKRPRK